MRLLEWERVDRRVLGAIRFVDAATGMSVRRPLRIEGEGFRLIRNRSFDYVILQMSGLESHLTEFEAPPLTPDLGSVALALSVSDPSRHYLPQLVSLALPRDPDKDNAGNPDSLFQAALVPLYPSSIAPVGGNWSILRLAITQPPTPPATIGDPIPGAMVRVVRQEDSAVIARGMSDTRGQALIIIPGIPVTNFSNTGGGGPGGGSGGGGPGGATDTGMASGPVVALDTPVSLEFIVDPDLNWPVNPHTLESNGDTWTRSPESPASLDFNLRTGRSENVAVVIDMTIGS